MKWGIFRESLECTKEKHPFEVSDNTDEQDMVQELFHQICAAPIQPEAMSDFPVLAILENFPSEVVVESGMHRTFSMYD